MCLSVQRGYPQIYIHKNIKHIQPYIDTSYLYMHTCIQGCNALKLLEVLTHATIMHTLMLMEALICATILNIHHNDGGPYWADL